MEFDVCSLKWLDFTGSRNVKSVTEKRRSNACRLWCTEGVMERTGSFNFPQFNKNDSRVNPGIQVLIHLAIAVEFAPLYSHNQFTQENHYDTALLVTIIIILADKGNMIWVSQALIWYKDSVLSLWEIQLWRKTVVRSFYLHNGKSYMGKTVSLYWFSPLFYFLSYPSCVQLLFIQFLT